MVSIVRKFGLPKRGEFVIVTVKRITPNAAWCNLNEYPELEGMIHVSEVAGKWVRDIRKFVKMNKTYVAKVLYVDSKSNFVKLSLKRVDRIEKKRKMEEYKLEQRAEKILELASKRLKKSLDQAYEEVGYKLQEMFGSLHEAIEEIAINKKIDGIPEAWNKALFEIAKKSIVEKERKVSAELILKTKRGNGIEIIKDVLLKLKRDGFNVKYITAPYYRVWLVTKDPKSGERALISELEKIVKSFDGEASYRMLT